MTWPQGSIPFDVDGIVAGGRRINASADQLRVAPSAKALVMTAAEYIDGLPEAIQAETAHRLNCAIDGLADGPYGEAAEPAAPTRVLVAPAPSQALFRPLAKAPAAGPGLVRPLRRARAA